VAQVDGQKVLIFPPIFGHLGGNGIVAMVVCATALVLLPFFAQISIVLGLIAHPAPFRVWEDHVVLLDQGPQLFLFIFTEKPRKVLNILQVNKH